MITARPLSRQRGVTLLGASLCALGGAVAQDGTLDITFSGDGQYGFMQQIPDVLTMDILETGGKIFPVLCGVNGTQAAYIMKLNADGTHDNSFDADGILEFPGINIWDAAVSLDGSGIHVLSSDTGGYRIGTLDLDGALVQGWTSVAAPYGASFAKMLVDDQGRIVIGTGAYINGTNYGMVIRLNTDFTIDNAFGTNGAAYTPDAPFCYPLMEIDNLGRIVLGSYQPSCAGLWRFNTDGSVDTTFNYDLDLMPFIQDNWILDFAIAQDNSIYLQPNTWAWPSYLFKLHEDGSLDTGFGNGGNMILTDPEPLWYTGPDELLIEPGGGLIVLAQAYGPDGYMSGKYLTRLDANGVIDNTFNPGIQQIDDNGYSLRINFHCATLQADGKVLSMDQVVKWQNGALFGYAPLITRFNNEAGAVAAAVSEAGPRAEQANAYPNPTNGSVVLRAPNNATWRNATVVITNSAGARVGQEQMLNDRIDLSAFSPGIYFCMVKHAGGSAHARIVKE